MTDFQEVYARFFRDVYRFSLAMTRNESVAEEVTQETFFKAMENLDKFDGRCKLSVWLCQIARNTYISMRRKEKTADLVFDTELVSDQLDMEENYSKQETAFAIHRVLHDLPEPYKEVFSLRVFGELSFGQIGELYGKTEGWARVTYHRAKLKIKEKLG